MNSWLFFALLAPLFWAFTNIFDGAMRRNFLKDDLALTWAGAACRLPFVILLFLIYGLHFPSLISFVGMIIAGMLWTIPMFFYYKALNDEDPSRISLLIQLVPIFTLPIAFIAINERLSSFQIFAFIILIFAGIFASLKKISGRWGISRSFFLMAFACLMWATSDVLFKKFEPSYPNFVSALAVDFLGAFLISFFLFLMPKNRKRVFSSLSGIPIKAWVMFFSSVTFGVVGGFSFNYALTLGKVSLTSVLMGIQPLLVIVLGLLLRLFIKEIGKEDLGLNALLFKVLSFVFVIAGLILLQF